MIILTNIETLEKNGWWYNEKLSSSEKDPIFYKVINDKVHLTAWKEDPLDEKRRTWEVFYSAKYDEITPDLLEAVVKELKAIEVKEARECK